MKQSLYTVAFTVLACGVSALIVTAAHEAWKDGYALQLEADKALAIAQALGLADDDLPADQAAERLTSLHVRLEEAGGPGLWRVHRNGRLEGWIKDITGMGHGGEIHGVLALEPDRRTIRGLRFHRQQETPSMGGRIVRGDFTGQFVGRQLRLDGAELGLRLAPAGAAAGLHEVHGVTGATRTSQAVVAMIGSAVREMLTGDAMVPLRIELPPPLTPGPTHPPVGSTARPPVFGARPAPLVPEGTRNLALHRPVTTGDDFPPIVGELEMIVDGNKLAGDGNFVEIGPMLSWVQIDLGEPCQIHAVAVWRNYARTAVTRCVVIQLADDEDFTRNVRTLYNNDAGGTAGLGAGSDPEYFETYEGLLVPVDGLVGRYIRLYSDGEHGDEMMSRYVEVEVHGRPGNRN